MTPVKQARLALSTLTVYRKVLSDEAVMKFCHVLEAACGVEARGFLTAWGELFSCLSTKGNLSTKGSLFTKSGLYFTRYVMQLLRYDDNAFSRQAASQPENRIDSVLAQAARHDMAAFCAVFQLTCADIKAQALDNFGDADEAEFIGNLPEFEMGRGEVPSPDELFESLTAFYRENGCGVFAHARAFQWHRGAGGEGSLRGVRLPDPVRLADLKGYEYERGVVVQNTLDFLSGGRANNLLLYGDRGTGKSSTVKAVFNEYSEKGLRIIELSKNSMPDFPLIARLISGMPLRFIIFIDDLSFSQDDDSYSALKAVLEGGLAARPDNCVIYATSNRRHLVRESFSERQGDEVHAADAMQEKLSLADRFGITVTFSSPDQRLYLEIVRTLANEKGLDAPQQELERGAVQWELRFNGRSPRSARQYIDWAAGRLQNGGTLTDF